MDNPPQIRNTTNLVRVVFATAAAGAVVATLAGCVSDSRISFAVGYEGWNATVDFTPRPDPKNPITPNK